MKKKPLVTLHQRKEAEKTIREFEKQQYHEFVKPFICLKCEEIYIIPGSINREYIKCAENIFDVNFEKGTLVKIAPHFGSDWDMARFGGGLCDHCIRDLDARKIIMSIDELESKLKI